MTTPKSETNILKKALEALSIFQATEAVYEDSVAVATMLRGESDRALIIILASYVEDALLDRIIYMLPEGQRYGSKIFKGGSLRNFEHRIAIAKALGAISEEQAKVLDVIRSMRNACSHSRKPISFRTPELLAIIPAMFGKNPQEIFKDPHDLTEIRSSFIVTAALLLWALRTVPHESPRPDLDGEVPESVRVEKLLLAALRKKLPPKVD
jgi:hypothetical protein